MDPTRDTFGPEQLLAHLGWVKALAHSLVADPNVADDVLQRVCLVALEKPPQDVSGEAGLRRWLSTLTRRMAHHAARAEGRRARRERAASRPERLPSTVDVAARRELLHSLVDAVTGLDERDFTVIVQRYFDGLDVAEIADAESVTPEAVRQRLSRARRRLRDRLERRAGPDRARWLAALGPLPVLSPAALSPETTLTLAWKSFGSLLMAKTTTALGAKLLLGVGLVSIIALTAWQQLDEPDAPSDTSPQTTLPTADREADVERTELPVALSLPTSVLPTPTASEVNVPAGGASPLPDTGTDLGTGFGLDAALASFATMDPDLQALNSWLRQLVNAASVLPETVAKDPQDGSMNGWVAIEGSELMGQFEIGPDGAFDLRFSIAGGPEAYPASSLHVGFQSDAGRPSDITTSLELHPDTSQAQFDALMDSLGDDPHPVGWHLSIGHDGTTGRPVLMTRQENALMVTVTGGPPALSAAWANDTTPYDLWLALLDPYAP